MEATNRKCKDCLLGLTEKECSVCNKVLGVDQFSVSQWKKPKNATNRKCKDCVAPIIAQMCVPEEIARSEWHEQLEEGRTKAKEFIPIKEAVT